MKKLLLFYLLASYISHAQEAPVAQCPIDPRINTYSALVAPILLGTSAGLASGALCGAVDAVTKDRLWLFTWLSTLALREHTINDVAKNNATFKVNYVERKSIATIYGHLTAWIAYYIVKNSIK